MARAGDHAFFCSLAVLALLAQPAWAQPAPATPTAGPAELQEADRIEAQVTALLNERRYYDAEPLAQQLYALRERLLGPDQPQTLDAARLLAGVHRAQQRFAEAEPLLVRVLTAAERRLAPGDPAIRRAANDLADLYEAQAIDYGADRESLYRRALELRDRLLGPDDIDTYGSVLRLSLFYENERRWAEAEPLQLRMLERARRLSGADDADVATQHNIIALFYARAGRDAEAEQHFGRALDMRERLYGMAHPNTRQSVTNFLDFYDQRGRNAEADALVQRYRDAMAAEAPPPPPPAAPRRNVLALGDEAESARLDEERERRLATERELGELGGQVEQLQAAGRFLEAEPLALRAFELGQGLGDDGALAPLDRLVEVYLSLGRYGEAEPLARRAFEQWQRRELGGSQYWSPNLLEAAYNLASVYHAQRRLEEAEQLYTRINGAAGPSVVFARRAANRLAVLLLERGNYEQAAAFAQTLVTAYAQGTQETAEELVRAGRHWADALSGLGNHQDAEAILTANLRTYEREYGPDHPDTLDTAAALAAALRDQGRLGEAIPLYRRAAAGSELAVGASHPATLSYLSGLVTALLSDAEAQGSAVEPARLLVANARARRAQGLASQQAQVQERVERSVTAVQFTLLADAAWAGRAPEGRAALLPEAFAALQDSLAGAAERSIAEQAARRYAQGRDQALAALIRERTSLQAQWSELNDRLAALFVAGDADPAAPAALRRELGATQARLGEIDARLRAEAPDYFALISPTSLDIAASQQLLQPDEAILLAVPGRFGTHLVAVTPDRIDWRRSDWDAERVRAAVQVLRRDIGQRPRFGPNGARAFDRTASHQLYHELVEPVAELIAGRRQVYVAAGGALAALPFSLLVAAPPEGADDDPAALRATRWFGDEVALVHIPSIQALALLRRAERSAGEQGSFVGIGNPLLRGEPADASEDSAAATDPSAARGTDIFFAPGRSRDGGIVADVATLHRLEPLPGTALELEAVRATLGAPASSLLMAEQATEPNVRSADLSRTSILLFSTHGLTVAEGAYVGAGESGLVLTPPAEARDGDDGYLAASEVTTLRLDADWLILSACNTATGDGVNSAGLGGLARAFFYAGARNLLASHWLVSDEVAPVMITRTLALERAGTPRAEAFRQAMREIRLDASHDEASRSWAHPYYWAPFVLIGDGG